MVHDSARRVLTREEILTTKDQEPSLPLPALESFDCGHFRVKAPRFVTPFTTDTVYASPTFPPYTIPAWETVLWGHLENATPLETTLSPMEALLSEPQDARVLE